MDFWVRVHQIPEVVIAIIYRGVVLGDHPLVDTAGQRHDSDSIEGAIKAPGGRWGRGIVPNVDGTPIFAQYLPNFGRGGTDVARHARVAAQNPDHQQKRKARGDEMD